MHKNNASAAASASGAETSSDDIGESSGDAVSALARSTLSSLGRGAMRNPFEDDADEVDSDEADDYDDDEESAGVAGRGSWWRGVVMRGGHPDGMDSDDDIDEEDDEEFGDFAMPEAESPPKSAPSNPIILKPLPVHPPQTSKTGFSSLWPFTGPGFGSATGNKEQDKDSTAAGESGAESSDAGDKVLNEDGVCVSRAVEAKRRTSLEDPDDEEVVV
jgi:SIT4-associating protein SAP185/190